MSKITKKIFSIYSRFPNWLKIISGGILTLLALFTNYWLDLPIPKALGSILNMPLIIMIFFNALLFRAEGKDLDALGFNLKKRNLIFLPLGLSIAIVAYIINFLIMAVLRDYTLHLNHDINIQQLLGSALVLLPMAAIQQFIVRSYCYVKTIEATNTRFATILFGILFVAMHNVFSNDIFNAVFLSLSLFVSHLLFSTAFLQSRTLYFAIGLHWGCNVANDHLLVEGLQGTSIVYSLPPEIIPSAESGPGILAILLYFLLINTGYFLAGLLIWKWKNLIIWFSGKHSKETTIPKT